MAAGVQGGNTVLRSIKWYKSLEKGSVRNQEGLFIVEGRRAVEQIIAISADSIDEIIFSDGYTLESEWSAFPLRRLSSDQLNSISSSKNSSGIIAVVKIPSLSFTDTLPRNPGQRILLLEHIQDPGNVGTIIRTAVAFDFSGIILSSLSADPFSSKVVQASAGALLSLWIRRSPKYLKCLQHLHSCGYSIVATSTKGASNMSIDSSNFVLALGNEGNGLSCEILSMADRHISIPINTAKIESLNVAISAAILMYSVAVRRE